ncbi:MAG: imidazole glycerol phosphate synthase subunit HisH [Spirochaetales bacterium]|jgi:glutamine amidotransferase|nr:imidazole glycerol phosphate synthase subunit HisH [Spirochaetales bacterium]
MKNNLTGIVDFNAGNLRSVETALDYLGADYLVSAFPEELNRCARLIFPGVGDAGAAMEVLNRTGLGDFIRDWVRRDRFLLGICIGCQLLFEYSMERDTPCLGILPGTVNLFPSEERDSSGRRFKVPHMGWNQVRLIAPHPLLSGLPPEASFYFVHSYYPAPAVEEPSPVPFVPGCRFDPRGTQPVPHALGITGYILDFASLLVRDNLMAAQFHPEKSGEHGLKLIRNFLELKG